MSQRVNTGNYLVLLITKLDEVGGDPDSRSGFRIRISTGKRGKLLSPSYNEVGTKLVVILIADPDSRSGYRRVSAGNYLVLLITKLDEVGGDPDSRSGFRIRISTGKRGKLPSLILEADYDVQ